jgi:hypothetical protein
MDCSAYLRDLNVGQRAAVEYGVGGSAGREISGPLLVIAGAGTGKTNTLAHRVAHLILGGALPERILLLTFTRRAAAEMTARAQRILTAARAAANGRRAASGGEIAWSGTFHAIGNRLLREHADSIGLDASFTVLDRSDSADLLNLVRNDLGLAKKSSRFPRKEICLAIYSHTVNAQCALSDTLGSAFPWCADWGAELKELFRGYVEAKQRDNVLDYDDLLLYWAHMMEEPALAGLVGERFDHVLVDEYQDPSWPAPSSRAAGAVLPQPSTSERRQPRSGGAHPFHPGCDSSALPAACGRPRPTCVAAISTGCTGERSGQDAGALEVADRPGDTGRHRSGPYRWQLLGLLASAFASFVCRSTIRPVRATFCKWP